MRALRVVGRGADDRTIVVETAASQSGALREQFTLPVDDNLQAAIRGDLPRVGQIPIERENQMRPR
ncbi:MAG TPA: septation protein SepH, partial [Pseudonocardiaceae bacterium]|nr:septation protein SepH [Pseudonocardiaceae bacterium]